MTGPESARGPKAVARFLRPRSVAIVGISSRPGSAGQNILQSLKLNKFAGDIHLVGRSEEPIDGRPVLKSPEELPEGVDLAVFTLPAASVRDTIAACVKRNVGSAMIFAAGFAEVGEQEMQDDIAKTARDGGLAIVGPNCLGVTNNVDGMMLHMLFAREALRFGPGSKPGLGLSGKAAACSATSSAPPTGAARRCPMSSRPATRSVLSRPISSNFSPTIPRPACW